MNKYICFLLISLFAFPYIALEANISNIVENYQNPNIIESQESLLELSIALKKRRRHGKRVSSNKRRTIKQRKKRKQIRKKMLKGKHKKYYAKKMKKKKKKTNKQRRKHSGNKSRFI